MCVCVCVCVRVRVRVWLQNNFLNVDGNQSILGRIYHILIIDVITKLYTARAGQIKNHVTEKITCWLTWGEEKKVA